MSEYQIAQRAVADLKSAVLAYVERVGPVSNAQVGRALGIHFGHSDQPGRHAGHVSRSILRLLEGEGLVAQDATKTWRSTSHDTEKLRSSGGPSV